MNPRPDHPPIPAGGSVASDIILTGGNRVRVLVPAEAAANGIGGAIQAGKPFITFPRIAGDILISVAHIAAIEPALQGEPAKEQTRERRLATP